MSTETETISKTNMKWYVVRTQNLREKSVAEKIIKEGEKGELIGKIGQVLVPLEKSFYLKDNKKVIRETVVFPGYIFMETNSIGQLKYFLKGVKGTSGFLTDRKGEVESLTELEINRMIGKQKESMDVKVDLFVVGEEVTITEGPFSTMKATIESIKDQKVTLAVSIFGRKTPLTLELHQINKK
jgi:transcriptional antiterminator NusG